MYDLRSQIKKMLLEFDSTALLQDKIVSIYNFKGIPNNEGAMLRYMDHSWDFLTSMVTTVNESVHCIYVKYKDIDSGKALIDMTVGSADNYAKEVKSANVCTIKCVIDRPKKFNYDTLTVTHVQGVKGTTIDEMCSSLSDNTFGFEITQLFPKIFWEGVFKYLGV